jgi:hypothetical protein
MKALPTKRPENSPDHTTDGQLLGDGGQTQTSLTVQGLDTMIDAWLCLS